MAMKVYRTCTCFQNDREDVEDDSRPDRSSTSKTDDNIEKFGDLDRFDHRLCTRTITETVGIDKKKNLFGKFYATILACKKCVPKILTLEQQEARFALTL
ncbi:hypothetical protein TNCV_238751 [Trichonephila clavipes]|nr:hypothetical protein TNCV_238751 [Trichonephila clavipes]